MGFGRTIVGAAFSVIVLIIAVILFNRYIGGDVVINFFRTLGEVMGKMLETVTEAFRTGGVPDLLGPWN